MTRRSGNVFGGIVVGVLATWLFATPARAAEAIAATTEPPTIDAAEPTEDGESTAKGPRDPFRPFNLDLQKKTGPPKTPLEQYDIGSLTLVAVIWNVAAPKAMVEDDSGLGYSIGIGTPIGRTGGIVRKIEPDQVIVEEEYTDFYGEKKKTERILKLKPEGEKKR